MPECYRCGQPIRFDPEERSGSGKMVPQEPEPAGGPHQCPNSEYGKSGGSSGTSTLFNLGNIEEKIESLTRKMEEVQKLMLKLILAVQTVQMRVEGQTGLPVGDVKQGA
jgi:hypothetical protein